MNILGSVLCVAFLGSSGFIPLEANLKSGSKLSDMFDIKIIKTNSPILALESKNQPPTENEDGTIDTVPTA